ncbi:hypothetical protein [Nonomuraea jiangxiensis]|uniref:Uncharacterized protein n=1 Tax=Nonomuraea jiangxiensis TaxID=633440 RepID=A0A1G9N2D3_9ACTN|nr:hypothetical protein [Nonomuraea jiangxiensis]SDL80544.1 hypothetical protein SAMN05421869_13115 [Nonomuraea jiangxiensis]
MRAGLDCNADSLADCVEAVCVLDEDQASVLKRLRWDAPAEPVGLSATGDDRRHTEIVTAHARRMAERLTGSAATAEQIMRDAERAYGGPRPFRLRVAGGRPIRLPVLNPWTCLRLAPQPLVRRMCRLTERTVTGPGKRTTLAAGLELVEAEVGDLIRFGGDVFLPTVGYLYCGKLVTAELAADSRGAGMQTCRQEVS